MASQELKIEAGRADAHYWKDLWRYRELMGFLAWRDIKVRYQQAVLGIAWALIQPLIQTFLLTFVFAMLAKMPDGNLPYLVIVLVGMLPWQLFSSAFNGAGNSLIGNSNLISKVYFPRLVVPLAALAVSLVDLAVPLAVTLPTCWFFGFWPTWRMLFLPFFTLGAMMIALGAGLWISALTIQYRDFRFISPFLLQIGLFVTPIGYRTDFLPNWRGLLALNPLTGMVEGYRWCLLNGRTEIYLPGLLVSAATTVILLVTGLWYFRKIERRFADII